MCGFGQIFDLKRIFVAALTSAFILAANISIAAPDTQSKLLRNLESKVWTADDYELPELETKIIRLLQLEPRNTFYHYLMSHLSIRMLAADPSDMRLMNQASQLAQQAIDLDAKSEFGYLALAELLDLMGHAEKGISLIREIKNAGLVPSWRIHFTLARLSVDSQSTDEILALFKKSLSAKDSIPNIIAPYVAAVLQTLEKPKFIDTLQKWEKEFPNTMFKHLLAIKKSESGEYKKAHANYTEILNAEPENTEALINDAILLYKHLKDYKQALSLFDRVDSFKSKKIPSAIKPVFHAHMATVLLKTGRKVDARKRFIKALQSSTNLTSMMNFVSNSYKEEKQIGQLINVLKEANIEIPGKAILHAYLGEVYSESQNDHRSALTHFANAITLEPDRSEYYNAMGLAYYRLDEYPESLKLFSAASKIDPSDSTAQYNKACILAKTGRHQEALTSLEVAIRLDPLLGQTALKDGDFASMNNLQAFIDLIGQPQVNTVAH